MPIARKKIVVLTLKKYLAPQVKLFLRERYNCTFIERPTKDYPIEKVNLILFCGGPDVNPFIYNESVSNFTKINNIRDLREMYIFNKYSKHNIPKLGICRGAQLCCVLSDGKLIQHVTGHNHTHSVTTKEGDKFKVTSTHHQMMKPFNLNSKDYEIIARSTKKESFNYYNGNNQSIKFGKDFVEPEIVYFNKTKSLAIQGHPERKHATKLFKEYSYELIDKLLLNEL